MLKLNESQLVKMAVTGKIANPVRFSTFELDHEGRGHAVPSVGGIVYNVKVGDPAFGWRGDHIEPGVSLVFDEEKRNGGPNRAFNFLSCIGNEITVTTGAAKGAKGVVTGIHGGVEHVIADFEQKTLEKLIGDEKFLIRALGQGLQIQECPLVFCYNLDPALLKKMRVKIKAGGGLEVPVTHKIPSAIMGSGIGHPDPGSGDYDITTQDAKTVRRLGLETLRFGDFVAITDADNTYGRHYYEGAVTIAIVSHSDSFISGHGPGLTTLLSSKGGKIKPVIDARANLGKVLGIGRFRS
ncbi:MAG TPA: DUF4438 domain-containing protein [Candidatus Omnitrophota bacterium]|nr:DUF4438 domain-containing protein [Candidatus Omnitrophota bacterium]